MVLPFAMVDNMGWWAIPVTTLITFTLYGIDGIASQLEDPFRRNKIDINMDDIVEDIRSEILVLVDEWKRVGEGEGGDRGKWFDEVGGMKTPEFGAQGGGWRGGYEECCENAGV